MAGREPLLPFGEGARRRATQEPLLPAGTGDQGHAGRRTSQEEATPRYQLDVIMKAREKESITKSFEDLETAVLNRIGIRDVTEKSMKKLTRKLKMMKVLACCADWAWRLAGRCSRGCRGCGRWLFGKNRPRAGQWAVFFRVMDKAYETNGDFPSGLGVLTLGTVENIEMKRFVPTGMDSNGAWLSWRWGSVEGHLSPSFPVISQQMKETWNIPEGEFFAFSYPLSVQDLDALDLDNQASDCYLLRNFFRNGGYMCFARHQASVPVLKSSRSCASCIATMSGYTLQHVLAVNPVEEGGGVTLTFGPPHWLRIKDTHKQWDHRNPITLKYFRDRGAHEFCWVAPQDRISDEACPFGFPSGGFLYFGSLPEPEPCARALAEAEQETKTCNELWYRRHMKALARALQYERDAHLHNERSMMGELEAFFAIDEASAGTVGGAMQGLKALDRARWVLNVEKSDGFFSTIYFSLLWFRYPIILLMSTMLMAAAFAGVQMQLVFSIFAALYKNMPVTEMTQAFFLALPLLIAVTSILVDQLTDLIFEALDPPYFVRVRATVMTVFCEFNRKHKREGRMPGPKLCLFVDFLCILGLELLPLFGLIYNYIQMKCGLCHRHLFYMGHKGMQDALLGGYYSGLIYMCVSMVFIYTWFDVAYGVMEWRRPSNRSLRFTLERIEAAINKYNIYPMKLWWRHGAFLAAWNHGMEVSESPQESNEFKESKEGQSGEDARKRMSVGVQLDKDTAYIGHYNQNPQHGHDKYHRLNVHVRLLLSSLRLVSWCLLWFVLCWSLMRMSSYPEMSPWVHDHIQLVLLTTALALVLAVVGVSREIDHYFPKLIGWTYYGCVLVFAMIAIMLLAGGQEFRVHTEAGGAGLQPIMTVQAAEGPEALPRVWTDPGEAQPYAICRHWWGSHGAKVSALDLAALSWIAYEPDEKNIRELIRQSFGDGPQLVHFTPYEDIPRWISVNFTSQEEGAPHTLVVAVKGTSTFADGYLDTDLFTSIKVLQLFDFIAPVLLMVPVDMVQYLLSMVKNKAGDGGVFERDVWTHLRHKVEELRRAHRRDARIVLTGHSLGGGIAEIVAGQMGLPGLVWSAPGTLYSQGYLNVTEERMQRDVTNIVPDNDLVPRVDLTEAVEQRIQCWGKDHTVADPVLCHKVVKSACEVWRVCGDAPKNRDFSASCKQFVARHELGALYPVLNHPVVEV